MNTPQDAMHAVMMAAEPFESRWTMNALKALDPDLHEAMTDQLEMYSEALVTADRVSEVRRQAEATIRGYQACIKALTEAAVPDDAYTLGVDPKTGTKVAIGRNKKAISRVQEVEGSNVIWINPDEVAALVAAMDSVALVKSMWPGAEIEAIERYPEEAAKGDVK